MTCEGDIETSEKRPVGVCQRHGSLIRRTVGHEKILRKAVSVLLLDFNFDNT